MSCRCITSRTNSSRAGPETHVFHFHGMAFLAIKFKILLSSSKCKIFLRIWKQLSFIENMIHYRIYVLLFPNNSSKFWFFFPVQLYFGNAFASWQLHFFFFSGIFLQGNLADHFLRMLLSWSIWTPCMVMTHFSYLGFFICCRLSRINITLNQYICFNCLWYVETWAPMASRAKFHPFLLSPWWRKCKFSFMSNFNLIIRLIMKANVWF